MNAITNPPGISAGVTTARDLGLDPRQRQLKVRPLDFMVLLSQMLAQSTPEFPENQEGEMETQGTEAATLENRISDLQKLNDAQGAKDAMSLLAEALLQNPQLFAEVSALCQTQLEQQRAQGLFAPIDQKSWQINQNLTTSKIALDSRLQGINLAPAQTLAQDFLQLLQTTPATVSQDLVATFQQILNPQKPLPSASVENLARDPILGERGEGVDQKNPFPKAVLTQQVGFLGSSGGEQAPISWGGNKPLVAQASFENTLMSLRQLLQKQKSEDQSPETVDVEKLQKEVDQGKSHWAATLTNNRQPGEPRIAGEGMSSSTEQVPTADLLAQVKKGLLQQIKGDKEQFVIKLRPENLGEITVKMTQLSGKISLSIMASSEQTLKLLHSELAVLSQALRPLNAEIQQVTSSQTGGNPHDAHPNGQALADQQQFANSKQQNFTQGGQTTHHLSEKELAILDELGDPIELKAQADSLKSGLDRYI